MAPKTIGSKVPRPKAKALARFTRALLDDLDALEQMLDGGKLEQGVHRVGAEQELFLVDADLNPAPVAPRILEQQADPRLTTEIARFNIEANLQAREFTDACLSDMHEELERIVATARTAARKVDAEVLLTGILPTLRQADLSEANMAPVPRYEALNRAFRRERGDAFRVRIDGMDAFEVLHDNVMLESCNTSFQLHFQVGPAEFNRFYNAAQLVTAPVLACAANSPTLLRRRLWAETRIALFPESVDDRSDLQKRRGDPPRVHFGDDWVRDSVLELLREDVARFRVLLTRGAAEDSLAVLQAGGIPKLSTLCFFNGTVYRWNRPCYGITAGVPHLRIENRTLPSGPSVIDEMANAAFFFGLLCAVANHDTGPEDLLRFDEVKRNFFHAARHGLDAQLTWVDGTRRPVRQLVRSELLPEARRGLLDAGIDREDVARYLDIIEHRVRSGRNGASWFLDSLATNSPQASEDSLFRGVTAAMLTEQLGGKPVHEWPPAKLPASTFPRSNDRTTVGQVMSTRVLRVRRDDIVALPGSLMGWERARYVAVEDAEGRLVGLVSAGSLLRVLTRNTDSQEPLLVADIMDEEPMTVSKATPLLQAVERMEEHRIGCLPVVENGKLIGMLTHDEIVSLTRDLLRSDARGEAE